jgi:hypothetical protein
MDTERHDGIGAAENCSGASIMTPPPIPLC